MIRDHELRATVDRARAFDPDAWEALYRRLYPRLYAYANRRLPPSECDDAVSESFTRAMDAIDRFRWRGAGFDAWVFGILRNVVYERYRSRPLQSSTDAVPELASGESGPLDQLVTHEEAIDVRAAFARLGPEDREVLELRVLGDLDAKAVGSVLGKRPGAVRMAQQRALQRLGDMLAEPS